MNVEFVEVKVSTGKEENVIVKVEYLIVKVFVVEKTVTINVEYAEEKVLIAQIKNAIASDMF